MIKHQHRFEAVEKPLTNQQELGPDADMYKDEPPLELSYNLATIGTLTTEMMSRIEDDVLSDAAAGKTPAEVQHAIYAKLEGLGIDPSVARDDVLAVRVVGLDGRSIIRPLFIAASDFGTEIRNVEMTEIETNLNDEVADPEEEHRQERLIDEFFKNQLAATRELEELHKQHTESYRTRRETLGQLIGGVNTIAAALERGDRVSTDALRTLLNEIAPAVQQLMNDEIGHGDAERSRASSCSTALEASASTASSQLSEEQSVQVRPILQRAHIITQDIVSNRQSSVVVSESMKASVVRIATTLNDALHSGHGHEMSGGHLGQIIRELEGLSQQHDTLSAKIPELLEQLKKVLERPSSDSR